MEGWIITIIIAVFGTTALKGIRIINQGNEALVETLGKYSGRKLEPGLSFIVPFLDKVAYKETIR